MDCGPSRSARGGGAVLASGRGRRPPCRALLDVANRRARSPRSAEGRAAGQERLEDLGVTKRGSAVAGGGGARMMATATRAFNGSSAARRRHHGRVGERPRSSRFRECWSAA
jgi:hypothetical protein